MGNTQSTGANSTDGDSLKTLPQLIDYIATNYIITQNFKDMENLADPQYCDELVVLTSKVISQKLNDMQVRYLAQRLKEGVVVNEMTKGKVIYLKKKELPKLDVQNSTTKRRLCIGIAKFYVKVAHLFAAIVSTINPTYTFVDDAGVKQTVGLLNKKAIPEGTNAQLTKVGLCSSRINALLNGQDYEQSGSNGDVLVNPKFCKLNATGSSGATRMLDSEPGIPELKKLYYDRYDFDQSRTDVKVKNKGFFEMTPEMQKEYDADVKRFYMEFTGNEKVPDDIKEFSQIKLRDFQRSKGCAQGGVYTKGYTGSLKQQLFKEYVNHTKAMIEHANASQDKLLEVLDKLFVFSYDQVDKKKRIIINPALNDESLQVLVDDTRKLIVNLYLTCERDFVDGLKIYEAIVEKQVLDTSMAQLRSMNDTLDLMGTAEHIANNNVEKLPINNIQPPQKEVSAPIPSSTITGDKKPEDLSKTINDVEKAPADMKEIVGEKVEEGKQIITGEAKEAINDVEKKVEEGLGLGK